MIHHTCTHTLKLHYSFNTIYEGVVFEMIHVCKQNHSTCNVACMQTYHSQVLHFCFSFDNLLCMYITSDGIPWYLLLYF